MSRGAGAVDLGVLAPSPIVGLIAALSLIVACERGGGTPSTGPVQAVPQTVVLATIDTWRRDAAGFLGARDPSPTPFLDGLAEQGLVASDAMAPVPLTGPSHWSILSGRWPWRDGMRVNGDKPRDERGLTLAEILADNGWQTAAFVSCSVLEARFGFAAGFDHFDDDFHAGGGLSDVAMSERRGDATVRSALAWLKARSSTKAVFLWVHLFDPHAPYTSPEGSLPGKHGDYLGEVAFADAQLAKLAAGLAQLGRPLGRSLWVVVSDHGEGLGEHGERGHGLILHGATTRIPFVMAGGRVPARRLEGLSSTVDVLPTVLGNLGIEAPVSDGIDLGGAAAPIERAIPLESVMGARALALAPAWGLRFERWLWESSPADHLWDLTQDPSEQRDRGGELPGRVEQMKRMRQQIGMPGLDPPQPHEHETIEKLRALGYLSTTGTGGNRDVRSFGVGAVEWQSRVQSLLATADYAEAEILARKGIDRYPQFLDLWIAAGFVAVGLGDLTEAERRFRRAVALDPDYPPAHLNLANVLLQSGRMEEAETAYREVLEVNPDDPFALYNLGALLAGQDRNLEAAVPWRRFADLYPGHPKADGIRGALAAWAGPNRAD